jgi:hypothetical protein
MVPERVYVDLMADQNEGPTPESIARAWAAQQRERAAFTENTGVMVNRDGRMLRRNHPDLVQH